MLFVFILSVIGLINSITVQGQSCVTENEVVGTCVKSLDCSGFYEIINTQNPNAIEIFVNSHISCGVRSIDRDPIICCTSSSRVPISQPVLEKSMHVSSKPATLLTASDGCGLSGNTNVNSDDQSVDINNWPWLALIGYTAYSGQFSFRCGGSLITKRHVLTAAHCITFDLTFARLGEHDLRIDTETKHIDVPVIKIVSHPNYDERNGNSDLSILTLGRDVLFSREISPICLPISDQMDNFEGYRPFIAGWGFSTQNDTTTTNVLQELQLPVLPNINCTDQFDNNLAKDIICAGFPSGDEDICQGDSGGPLMIPTLEHREYYFYQIGILSKSDGCRRRQGKPNLFLKVSSFISWIQDQVAKPI